MTDVTILVPSQEYMGNAGARIRYSRLSAGLGLTVSLEDIAQFDATKGAYDVLIISKCHDARALLAAISARRRGARVGVDLFDDYFSQQADSRLCRFRRWLAQLLPLCDFALCSTQLMASVVGRYRNDIPVHVLNDPVVPIEYSQLSAALEEKMRDARVEGRWRIAWFGVGDNPHFPIGISDLAAFSDLLARLGTDGRAVELSILTNARALDADRLAMIARLPVPTAIELWSEQAEADLLARSLACFLPVNAQRFSAAKSLNRALTSLAAGCQVISAGYPLYGALEPFVYRDIQNFIDDVRNADLRLASRSIDRFRRAIDEMASPERETERLADFLKEVPPPPPAPEAETLFLVHGIATNGAAHKTVKAIGGLSVASPFCPTPLGFDIIFETRPGGDLAMLVSDKGLKRLREDVRGRAMIASEIGGRPFWEVRSDRPNLPAQPGWQERSLPLDLSLYPSVMQRIREELMTGFGQGCAIVSDNSPLPFDLVA